MGGVAQTIVGHPLDTIKVRLQTQGQHGKPKKYRGVFHCCATVIREERVTGLFKGLLSPLTGIAALNAVLFTSYGFAKSKFEADESGNLSIGAITACGVFAGIAQCVVVCPMELLKVRLQAQGGMKGTPGYKPIYNGNIDCIKKTVRAQGISGLYKGMYGCLLREIPAYGFCFLSYEVIQRSLADFYNCGIGDLGPASLMFAGGSAGIVCWVTSYPQDVILSRLRLQPLNQPSEFRTRMFDGGFWHCGREVVRTSGWRGLMAGFPACALRAFPANAASFLGYEMTKDFLTQYT
eukprot:CAMPEP_0201515114 /NCGR_PEP_ID=MMETSP0161_2-20130828/6766_1 /ASSEMBLY_ACC=CAM_ASM_000251 /TAXON_ID=180227 /ORGANISM="Neoparamoeba aestuarina, Strain SoJaBio B1-5/56/2" /LENGTH=292 /DNA_ID=CAMNT_0047911847 /DNA_START=250 /DNA_END=1128 /DNA_ORIENTATION=-